MISLSSGDIIFHRKVMRIKKNIIKEYYLIQHKILRTFVIIKKCIAWRRETH